MRFRSIGWCHGALAVVLLSSPTALAAQGAPVASGSLSLTDAVRTAIERSPRIEGARFSLREAEAQVKEAWGGVYPKVDFSADYTRNVSPAINFLPAIIFDPTAGPDDQVAVQFGADNLWQTMFTLEQPLFDGRAFIGVGAAGRYQELQEEMLRGEIQGVVSRVRRLYYGALLAQEQRRLTENSVARVQEALTEMQALQRAGLGAEYDVLRLEVELGNLEPNLRRAENAVEQTLRDLAIELDLDPETLQVEGSLATLVLSDLAANSPENREILAWAGPSDVDDAGAASLIEAALEFRTDLRQLSITEGLREAELRAEQTTYLPRVSLFGNYAISASQNGSPDFFGEPRAFSRRIGVQVTLSLFDGFGREARVAQKRAVVGAAQSQTSFARTLAGGEIRRIIEEVEESRLRATAQQRAVEQAQRGFEIASAQFREGLGSRLDMTDAEVALRQSEFNYAQAIYDHLSARAELEEATGQVPVALSELAGR